MILTAYFTYHQDPQRRKAWEASARGIFPLINSCFKHGIPIVIFHDGIKDIPFNPLVKQVFVKASHDFTPNVYRYFCYLDWLKRNTIEKVFLVDSTDVKVLHNPFKHLRDGVLYVGHESNFTGCFDWIKEKQEPHVRIPDSQEVTYPFHDDPAPNCGIIGGHSGVVIDFLNKLTALHSLYSRGLTSSVDMAFFNYTIRKYNVEIEYGSHINTEFKKYEQTKAWFKHK